MSRRVSVQRLGELPRCFPCMSTSRGILLRDGSLRSPACNPPAQARAPHPPPASQEGKNTFFTGGFSPSIPTRGTVLPPSAPTPLLHHLCCPLAALPSGAVLPRSLAEPTRGPPPVHTASAKTSGLNPALKQKSLF